ncbi:four helix bundle protein [Patescibacteria group bacterium]|nr:four helix bundle protein [Patescibacteria group bacterium]
MAFRFQNFALYKDLRIFVKEIYLLTAKLPPKEKYGLISQLRRSVTSVILNFAEGAMRKSDAEFNRFLMISIGSLGEVVAILDVCLDLKYITPSAHKKYMLECETVAKRLYGFSGKLKSSL